MKKRIFSAMRPTGRLHLGHLVGALNNWVELQKSYECVFGVADWHALLGEYEQSEGISVNITEMVIDWLACGIDPEQSIVFVQSQVPEHTELHLIFSCVTPLGWLERNPTYKEQMREITTRDLQTYGFLGYPVLQAADILLYHARAVPIGEDQLPHVELTREIARRFNHLFKQDVFADCEAILTQTPRLLGLDGRKMSKSYQNAINLADSEKETKEKISKMFTDPQRIRVSDPGHPDTCNVHSYFRVFVPSLAPVVHDWCSRAEKGCTECKAILAQHLIEQLRPLRERRERLSQDRGHIAEILDAGRRKAQRIAQNTMDEVKKAVFK